MRRIIAVVVSVALGALTVTALPANGATQTKPGFHKASKSQVRQLAAALGKAYPDWYRGIPAQCLSAVQANSSSEWYIFWTGENRSQACGPWVCDAACERLVKHSSGGKANIVAQGSLGMYTCAEMARLVRQAGGSASVTKDLKAGYPSPWGTIKACGGPH